MPKIEWSKLIDPKYWLEGVAGNSSITPIVERNSFFFWFFLYLFASLLIFGIVLRVAQAFMHPQHPFQNRFPVWGNNAIWMGILGLLWFTMRQLSVGFLGARFWLLTGLVWFLIVAYFVVRYFFSFYPLEIAYFKKTFSPKIEKV